MKTASLNSRRYSLEPGDGTHYEFSVIECRGHNGTIRGVGDGEEYITVVIHNPGTGAYEVRKSGLVPLYAHMVHYLKPHFKCDEYTLAAVLLAVAELLEDPDDLKRAGEAMLYAPQTLGHC